MLHIRKASKKDIDACLAAQASEKDTTFTRKDYLNSLKNPDVIFLVAELDGKVIGYILGFVTPTRNREAMVAGTMIHKKFRGKKLGSQLVKHFTKKVFDRNVKEIWALVERGYPMKFYKYCGFKETGKAWYETLLRSSKSPQHPS